MTKATDSLAALIDRAEHADPAHRIDLRDPIAAHGAAAIEAVTPWLKVQGLAAFAIRVIAKAGLDGEREAAQAALRAARRRMDTSLRADTDWALSVLKVTATPVPASTSSRRPAAVRKARGTSLLLRPAAGRGPPALRRQRFLGRVALLGLGQLLPALLARLHDPLAGALLDLGPGDA